MDKRLVKKNAFLIATLAVSIIVTCGLVVFSLVEYIKTNGYIKDAAVLRSKIVEFGRTMPAPVDGNKAPLKEDTIIYNRAADELNSHFGEPFRKASDRFVELLEIPVPESVPPQERVIEARKIFISRFREGVDIGSMTPAELDFHWQKFRDTFPRWETARAEFAKLAQEATVEDLSADPDAVDDVLRSSFGIPRTLRGDQEKLRTMIRNFQFRIGQILSQGRVQVVCSPSFGFDASSEHGAYTAAEFPNIIRHWDVIGDLMRRLTASEVPTLHDLVIRFSSVENGRGNYESSFVSEGNYEMAHYTIEISAPIASVRKFADALENAYVDNRMYVIRSIFLYAEEDGAYSIFAQKRLGDDEQFGSEESAPATRTVSRRRGRRVAADDESESGGSQISEAQLQRERRRLAEKMQQERESKLPYYDRSGYGQTLIGGGKLVHAIIDVDYVVSSAK